MSKLPIHSESGLAQTIPFNRRHLLGLAGALALSSLGACGGGDEEVASTDADPVPDTSGQEDIPEPQVSTLAGSGEIGSADGLGASASFYNPTSLAVDASGNVFVADRLNNSIRKITPAGEVSTLAGSLTPGYADGTGADARFYWPGGLTIDAEGNLYVADTENHRMRKVTPEGVVTTVAGSGNNGFADGTGSAASFHYPTSAAVDPEGNIIIADLYNSRVRKMTPAGEVTTLAGTGAFGAADGPALEATFSGLVGVTVDGEGNVYVADFNNNKFRKISSTGQVTTLAGSGARGNVDGPAAEAEFAGVASVAVAKDGRIFLVDGGNHKIRVMTTDGVVSTYAGTGAIGDADGELLESSFQAPAGATFDAAGVLYVAEILNQKIRKIG